MYQVSIRPFVAPTDAYDKRILGRDVNQAAFQKSCDAQYFSDLISLVDSSDAKKESYQKSCVLYQEVIQENEMGDTKEAVRAAVSLAKLIYTHSGDCTGVTQYEEAEALCNKAIDLIHSSPLSIPDYYQVRHVQSTLIKVPYDPVAISKGVAHAERVTVEERDRLLQEIQGLLHTIQADKSKAS